MTVLCVIGARGGSQGLPGKNLRPLLGKPMIAWTIEQALATPEIDRVVVSTDSDAIAEAARAAGAQVPFMRPADLANDSAGKFQVWQHALQACEAHYQEQYEMLVDLDCTNPLREPADVSGVIAQFRQSRPRGVDAVFTVCPARKNPYFNVVEPDASGALRISKKLSAPVVARQAAPAVFDIVGSVYILTPEYLRRANTLMEGHTEGYDIGQEKSLDVDSAFDFMLIECLMKHRYGAQ
ncbi:MAG TPA: acylneuraminate cytidylyltransferase family protein [Dongiaceae bacterium]